MRKWLLGLVGALALSGCDNREETVPVSPQEAPKYTYYEDIDGKTRDFTLSTESRPVRDYRMEDLKQAAEDRRVMQLVEEARIDAEIRALTRPESRNYESVSSVRKDTFPFIEPTIKIATLEEVIPLELAHLYEKGAYARPLPEGFDKNQDGKLNENELTEYRDAVRCILESIRIASEQRAEFYNSQKKK